MHYTRHWATGIVDAIYPEMHLLTPQEEAPCTCACAAPVASMYTTLCVIGAPWSRNSIAENFTRNELPEHPIDVNAYNKG